MEVTIRRGAVFPSIIVVDTGNAKLDIHTTTLPNIEVAGFKEVARMSVQKAQDGTQPDSYIAMKALLALDTRGLKEELLRIERQTRLMKEGVAYKVEQGNMSPSSLTGRILGMSGMDANQPTWVVNAMSGTYLNQLHTIVSDVLEAREKGEEVRVVDTLAVEKLLVPKNNSRINRSDEGGGTHRL